MTDYSGLYKSLGYEFDDPSLLRLALSHRSSGRSNNERLEFLGDSILGFIIAEQLFNELPTAREGELSRLRAGLVQKSTLADIARELEVGSYLILGQGEKKSGGPRRESILADSLEAIISAIYQDAGLDVCRRVVISWFRTRLDSLEKETVQKDAKTRLQEYLQARKMRLPVYDVEEVIGKDHEQTFHVLCRIEALQLNISGMGGSRREAEQQAAEEALQALDP